MAAKRFVFFFASSEDGERPQKKRPIEEPQNTMIGWVIEGSLNSKLLTIWRVEMQMKSR